MCEQKLQHSKVKSFDTNVVFKDVLVVYFCCSDLAQKMEEKKRNFVQACVVKVHSVISIIECLIKENVAPSRAL